VTADGICLLTISSLDSGLVRCVGEWAYEKIHWLTRYFGIFSSGMKYKWDGLNYVEICSGPGRCILRDSGDEIDGTALSIVNHDSFNIIKKGIFIDNNQDSVEILNLRIRNLNKGSIAEAIIGDYHDVSGIVDILDKLSQRHLNLVFLDPTDCSISFNLIKRIDEVLNNVDFIINIAIGTDLSRNIQKAILNQRFDVTRKYIKFLGNADYFRDKDVILAAKNNQLGKMRLAFLEEYKKSLGTIGYKYIDVVSVRHYYDLLFASKHSTGLKFWNEARREEANGQRSLF